MSTSFDPAVEVKSLLEALVKAVVTSPDKASVHHSVHGSLIAFGIEVDREDVRRVIGAKGKHVKALTIIAKTLCESVGMTADLTVIEDEAPPAKTDVAERVNPLVGGKNKDFSRVKALLERTVTSIANSPSDVSVTERPLGMNKHILEIIANEPAYRRLYGTTTQFEYGEDGLILGSIKNIFDAIAKNHGKLLMTVMTKKA